MNRTLVPFLVTLVCAVAACGGSPPPQANAPSSANEDGEAQAARGAKLYADKCASCHGADGSGTKDGPPVVGKNALPLDPPAGAKYRKTQFHTALDVAQFVVKAMPADNPGSLKEDEYWDILAFDLKANGVPVAGKHIDATSAAGVVLH
jgi:cytochrome c